MTAQRTDPGTGTGSPGRTARRPSGSGLEDGDRASRVIRLDPPDGTHGVFRDAAVVVVLSRPIDAPTPGMDAFAVYDHEGRVPGRVKASPDGQILVWTAERLLAPGVEHVVRLAGLRDARGREMPPHESAFIPCDLTMSDLLS